jgi:hypothetical protein
MPAVKGHSILFFDPDPKVCRVAERALLATQSEVKVIQEEAAFKQAATGEKYDLYMVNFDPPSAINSHWGDFFDDLAVSNPKGRVVLHATARTGLPAAHAGPQVRAQPHRQG